MRADARRNYERIVTTARDAFFADGIDVPLDEIVRRAEVGAGTLYRHFPSRDALIEAVYRQEIEELAATADRFAEQLPPGEAVLAWMREQVRFVTQRHGFASALKGAVDQDSETFAYCKEKLRSAVGGILEPAQAAGVIRAEIQPDDLMRLGHGIGVSGTYADEAGVERMLTVVLDGLKA